MPQGPFREAHPREQNEQSTCPITMCAALWNALKRKKTKQTKRQTVFETGGQRWTHTPRQLCCKRDKAKKNHYVKACGMARCISDDISLVPCSSAAFPGGTCRTGAPCLLVAAKRHPRLERRAPSSLDPLARPARC